MPCHEHVLRLKHLFLLLICPHVHQHAAAHSQSAMNLSYGFNAECGCAEMMYHGNRYHAIEEVRAHRQLETVTEERLEALVTVAADL